MASIGDVLFGIGKFVFEAVRDGIKDDIKTNFNQAKNFKSMSSEYSSYSDRKLADTAKNGTLMERAAANKELQNRNHNN